MDPERDKNLSLHLKFKISLISWSYINYSNEGKGFYASPTEDRETPDPPHEIDYVNITIGDGKHDGYVKAYHYCDFSALVFDTNELSKVPHRARHQRNYWSRL